ncbi:MAG: N-acetyltransferase [Proteobacteria bacterium]|nr:MAG: N-acetyltransferase [Pseudomonadota bacterium]
MYLETERVKLLEITRDYEDKLFILDSDPEVMRFISNGVTSSKEEVRAAIERIIALKNKHNGKFGCWAAFEKDSGEFMGWILFRPAHQDAENTKRIELGYRLMKSYWGRGVATEVSRALIEKGFREYSIEEIFAVAIKTNLGSQAVMKKSGLSFVREFYSDEFADSTDLFVEFSTRGGSNEI